MTVIVGWGLALALVLLVAVAVAASWYGRLGVERSQILAAVRAIAQLTAVSFILAAAVQTIWGALAFTAVMFGVAVYTTSRRVEVRTGWLWPAVPLLAGAVPVMAIIFLTGAAPLNGITVVSLGGIVIGNMMTVHTLTGRRCFAELAANVGVYEAALALGFIRGRAIGMVIDPVLREGLVPNLDQTRTVGLVTLPGAFIGVLLGGGSPIQAGASQVLVLIGIMAGQAITVVCAAALMRSAKLLPDNLRETLHP